jgi:type IV pilus assembly protein PilW
MRFSNLRATRESATGFSLIELMVAMLLGLIVVIGAGSVYLASKRSLTETEQIAALSENGRFALQLISNSARHIGFYGGANPADIRLDESLDAIPPSKDCNGGAEAYNTANSIFAVRTTSATVLGCIDDAVVGTDVLVIKGVGPSPITDADPNDPDAARNGIIDFPLDSWNTQAAYVISNSESGILLDGADPAPSVAEGTEFARAAAWPYRLAIYYIRAGATPTLSRKILAWDASAGAMRVQTQDLVPGVENLRFLFGYDTTNDGRVDTLANLTEVTTASAWDQVVSLQAFILLRSDVVDPNYENNKTYHLGDLPPFTPADNVRRILLQSDIVMRNPRLVLNGGV